MSQRELGGLVITPGQGQDISSVRMHTSGGCPAESDAYYAVMRGKGFPADGQIIIATTDVDMSHTAGFDVFLAQTLGDFAADNKTTLQGEYEISVRCIDSFSQAAHGKFSASVKFGSPTHYAAVGAAKGPDRVPDGPAPAPEEVVPPPQAPPPPVTSSSATAQPMAVQPALESASALPWLILAGFVIALTAVIAATAVLRKRGKEGDNDA